MDTYGAGFAVLWIGIWELVGLMWIYGFKNVSKDIALMIGSEPSFFWKLCWGAISPIFLIVVFILAVVGWSEPKYSSVSLHIFQINNQNLKFADFYKSGKWSKHFCF